MIVKIVNGIKAKIIAKQGSSGQPVFYARCFMDKKWSNLLIKNIRKAKDEVWWSDQAGMCVYGEVIFYDKRDDIQNVKFNIKGYDKYPNSRPRIQIKYMKNANTEDTPRFSNRRT